MIRDIKILNTEILSDNWYVLKKVTFEYIKKDGTRQVQSREAYDRGNSVYFPRRVIPMLPEELSNGLCSLNPKVDRLCMVCEMEVTSTGSIRKYRFYPAVMHSKARLTYTQVWDWLSKSAKPPKDQAWLLPNLENLYRLFKVLFKARGKRGAIDFETLETKMLFDEHDKI